MNRKWIWTAAGIALILLAIFPIAAFNSPSENAVFMKLEKNENESGSYTVSLDFEKADTIYEAGVILGAQNNGFSGSDGANVITADKDDDGRFSVSFVAPENESVVIQPYAKKEGSENADLFEGTILGESTPSDQNRFLAAGSSLLPTSAVTEYTGQAKDLASILESVSRRIWGTEDCILIKITGQASFDDEILFGQKTIFRSNGEMLPIIIDGGGNTTLDFTAEKVVAANHYSFDGLSMPIGKKDISVYAGCGSLTFANVDFGTEIYDAKAKFFGDNYTYAVFTGWNQKRLTANQTSGILKTGITFGENVSYFPPSGHLSAVGFDGTEYAPAEKINVTVLPVNTAASFVIDGAEASEVSARVGSAPVSDTVLELRSGTVATLCGNVEKAEKVALSGSIKFAVSGGKVAKAIKALTNASLSGNVTVEISEANGSAMIGSMEGAKNAEVLGNSTFTITGGEINGSAEVAAGKLSTTNTFSGGILYSDFYAASGSATKKITNTLSQCEIQGSFYGGGNTGVTTTEKAATTITGGTYGNVYPGNKKASAVDSILTIKNAKASGLVFDGQVGGRDLNKEAVEIISVREKKNILLGENARLHITCVYTSYMSRIPGLFDDKNPNPSATDYQVFEPLTQWKDGVEHIRFYHPQNPVDDPNTSEREDFNYNGFVRLMGHDRSFNVRHEDMATPIGNNSVISIWTGHTMENTRTYQDLSKYPTVPEEATIQDNGLTLDASKLTKAKLEALPKATQSMTTDERRQAVVGYFALQQGFSWTPGKTLLNYPTCAVNSIDHPDAWMCKTLEVGKIYGSIPYQSHGSGNLYRWMEYYDENTGIMYLTDAILENGGFLFGDESTDVYHKKEYEDQRHPGLKVFLNQCSVASFWGWARAINSASFYWTADMTVRNGFIPVGLYTYGYTYDGVYYDMTTIARFGEQKGNGSSEITNPSKYDTKHVIRDYNNKYGKNAFYNIYAQMKPGDCLVSSGHAMMVASVDPVKQTARVCEQIEGWAIYEKEGFTMSDVPYIRQGQVYKEYTFAQLMKSNYLAFTFAEYQDPNKPNDPNVIDDADYLDFYYNTIVAKTVNLKERYTRIQKKLDAEGIDINKVCGPDIEETQMYVYHDASHNNLIEANEVAIETGTATLSYNKLRYMVIGSNQSISDVFVTVERPDGTILKHRVIRPGTACTRVVSFNNMNCSNGDQMYSTMADINNGINTITISVQLGTGEKIVLFDHAKFGG